MKKQLPEYRQFLIDRLGYFRSKHKYSGRELSQMLGYSTMYISKFEAGEIRMPAEVLLSAIDACEVTPVEFFYPNIEKYKEHQEILNLYEKLTPESKSSLKEIMKNLK